MRIGKELEEARVGAGVELRRQDRLAGPPCLLHELITADPELGGRDALGRGDQTEIDAPRAQHQASREPERLHQRRQDDLCDLRRAAGAVDRDRHVGEPPEIRLLAAELPLIHGRERRSGERRHPQTGQGERRREWDVGDP